MGQGGPGPQNAPGVAEITRRINNKRRRDDDFDPNIFKRRAVSPSLSTHNSPVMQSPLQRDGGPWGSGSRPGSINGDRAGSGSGATSDAGSAGASVGSGSVPLNGRVGKGRVGLQGMTDTNDSLMRMAIE